MFSYPFYDHSISNFIEEYVETNLKTKDKVGFITKCVNDLTYSDYSENDESIIDKHNLQNYLLIHYSSETIFKDLDGKKVAKIIKELEEIEFIEEMIYYPLTLEDILSFYYIAYLHHNKNTIIKYLLSYLESI